MGDARCSDGFFGCLDNSGQCDRSRGGWIRGASFFLFKLVDVSFWGFHFVFDLDKKNCIKRRNDIHIFGNEFQTRSFAFIDCGDFAHSPGFSSFGLVGWTFGGVRSSFGGVIFFKQIDVSL